MGHNKNTVGMNIMLTGFLSPFVFYVFEQFGVAVVSALHVAPTLSAMVVVAGRRP